MPVHFDQEHARTLQQAHARCLVYRFYGSLPHDLHLRRDQALCDDIGHTLSGILQVIKIGHAGSLLGSDGGQLEDDLGNDPQGSLHPTEEFFKLEPPGLLGRLGARVDDLSGGKNNGHADHKIPGSTVLEGLCPG